MTFLDGIFHDARLNALTPNQHFISPCPNGKTLARWFSSVKPIFVAARKVAGLKSAGFNFGSVLVVQANVGLASLWLSRQFGQE